MSRKAKGIIFIIMAAFCFSAMNTFVKLSGDLPPIQKSFFRNAIAFWIALFILIRTEEKFKFNAKNLPFLISRSIFGTVGIICNFYAVDHLLLSDASMLNKLSPFFAVLASFFILKERVSFVQIISIIIAFIGSLFIIKPSFWAFSSSYPALIGLLGGACAGISYTFVRYLGNRGEQGAFIVMFFSGFSCLSVLPFFIFDFHPMTPIQVFYLLMAGISASGGQFAITNAYFNAPAKEISIFDYTQVIFAALLGLVLFAQYPDIYSVTGYVLICGISIITFLRNKKLAS
ncbi:MAG TPA: EamA family transporter [Lachnospiraceae bacterium]|nr:EamA family transporter [Lachnospiraceae bacterium]